MPEDAIEIVDAQGRPLSRTAAPAPAESASAPEDVSAGIPPLVWQAGRLGERRADAREREDERRNAEVELEVRNETVELSGVIGWDLSARAVNRAIDQAAQTGSVHLIIDSPGGYLDDGLAIYNRLRRHARAGVDVITEVGGMAASAAGLIFLAGDRRIMSESSVWMGHRAWAIFIAGGDADQIQRYTGRIVRSLRFFDRLISRLIARRTGIAQEEVTRKMNAEWWADGEDAVEQGIATELSGDEPASSTAPATPVGEGGPDGDDDREMAAAPAPAGAAARAPVLDALLARYGNVAGGSA